MPEVAPPPAAPVLAPEAPVPETAEAERPPEAAHPPEASGEGVALSAESVCPSCDEARIGAFCHACGQPFLTERITLRSLARQFAERFLKLERGLIGTFRAMFVRPGTVALDYIRGRQRPYVNPLSYLLIGAAVSLLILPWVMEGSIGGEDGGISETMQMGMDLGMALNSGQLEAMSSEKRAVFEDLMARVIPVYMETLAETLQRVTSLLALALALLLAGFFRLFFGPRHTYAENAVGTLYTTGHYYLLTVPLALVTLPLPRGAIIYTIAGGLVLLVLTYRVAAGMYGRSWRTAGLAWVSFWGAYISFSVVAMGMASLLSMWLARPEILAIAEEVRAAHGL